MKIYIFSSPRAPLGLTPNASHVHLSSCTAWKLSSRSTMSIPDVPAASQQKTRASSTSSTTAPRHLTVLCPATPGFARPDPPPCLLVHDKNRSYWFTRGALSIRTTRIPSTTGFPEMSSAACLCPHQNLIARGVAETLLANAGNCSGRARSGRARRVRN